MTAKKFRRIPTMKSPQALRDHLEELGLELPVAETLESGANSPLGQPLRAGSLTIGNRFTIHPMEGWDGTAEGQPSDLTRRRWHNFGLSGADLIWGGEAVAVRPDGRANPNQLLASEENRKSLGELREVLLAARREALGTEEGLVVGLQLTHSGRFARPRRKDLLEPLTVTRHPLLDPRFQGEGRYLEDEDLDRLVEDFVRAARMAHELGFDFVDVKHCHGYLGHELLGAHARPGRYGGSLENRTRFLRQIVEGIRAEAPGLEIGVRLSAFDMPPFEPDATRAEAGKLGPGKPTDYEAHLPYRHGFSVDPDDPLRVNLTECRAFLEILRDLGIQLVNLSAGSPYYNPHIQRPALYPPSDGYQPPEDPLVGVVRQIQAVRELKADFPDLVLVGTGYTYLQEYLPHVAQAVVEAGWVDSVGLGRLVLSYPDLPADLLAGRPLKSKLICRTFSDCTTAPRNGIVSGCFPLDPHYKKSEHMERLREVKGQNR